MTETVNMGRTMLILLAIITPSAVWTISMFFGNSASGKVWHFQYFQNSSDVMAFQELQDEERDTNRVVIGLVCYLVLQLIVTLAFYSKILYKTYASFLNTVLKPKNTSNEINKCSANVSKPTAKNIKTTNAEEDVSQPRMGNDKLRRSSTHPSHLLNTTNRSFSEYDNNETKTKGLIGDKSLGKTQELLHYEHICILSISTNTSYILSNNCLHLANVRIYIHYSNMLHISANYLCSAQ